ncbi:MAG TPA: hypothetical protein VGN00_14315 [Puia sp.]|jgi:hypothetical protein
MATVALEIWTGAYNTIVNPIELRVYREDDPLAIVVSQRHPAPHLADTWFFPGLDRTNYVFRIFEMTNMVDNDIIRQLGDDMNVVPGSASGVAYRATEQIVADVTTGFSSGVNTVVFDGTDGREDWRGWDIATLDRIGSDSMKRGVDYSYDKVTGTLTLLVDGDLFGPNEWYNVDFQVQTTDITQSTPTTFPQFTTPKIISVNYLISAGGDFGGLLIVRPADNYLEITLPDIATVVAGKLLTIEMAPSLDVQKCGKLIAAAGQPIDWLAGNRSDLYFCPTDSFSVYKFIDTTGADPVSMWRIFNPFGNFTRVGEQVVDDNIAANVFNKVLLDGSDGDIQQYARFYNDYLLQLPGAELVNYDDWGTGNNKYKFSLANSSNPANAGKFKFANRSNIFERITDGVRKPGDFQAQMILLHDHIMHGKGGIIGAGLTWFLSIINSAYSGGGSHKFGGKSNGPDPNMRTGDTGGSENIPNNIAVRKYCFV